MLGQRLMQGAKPSTPTLVLVGSDRESIWEGAIERQEGRGGGRTESGEIRVGLAVGLGVAHAHAHGERSPLGNRKSERVVVESVH